jgi:hypothetical protein
MAKVLATHYRYITKKGDDVARVVLRPGDTLPSGFDKEEAKSLEEAGLLLDEKRMTDDGVRIPLGAPDNEAEPEEKSTSGNKAGGADK